MVTSTTSPRRPPRDGPVRVTGTVTNRRRDVDGDQALRVRASTGPIDHGESPPPRRPCPRRRSATGSRPGTFDKVDAAGTRRDRALHDPGPTRQLGIAGPASTGSASTPSADATGRATCSPTAGRAPTSRWSRCRNAASTPPWSSRSAARSATPRRQHRRRRRWTARLAGGNLTLPGRPRRRRRRPAGHAGWSTRPWSTPYAGWPTATHPAARPGPSPMTGARAMVATARGAPPSTSRPPVPTGARTARRSPTDDSPRGRGRGQAGAAGWTAPRGLDANQILALPYGDLDVPQRLPHDPAVYDARGAAGAEVMGALGIAHTPAWRPPEGLISRRACVDHRGRAPPCWSTRPFSVPPDPPAIEDGCRAQGRRHLVRAPPRRPRPDAG